MQLLNILKRFKFITVVLLCLGVIESNAQTINYEQEFKADYQKAFTYLTENKWIADSLAKYHVPVNFALSIVFPELVRYSAIRDQMEIGGLKILYVSFGNDYADFSIGRFQMKPSFAEQISNDLRSLQLPYKFSILIRNHSISEENQRKAIVANLESIQKQVLYLTAFYQLCEQRFKSVSWKSEEEKLRFYATAYNCGYKKPLAYIQQMQNQSYYDISISGLGKKYKYADISTYYFKSQSKSIRQP
ncbi:hypothetical protein C3K47_02115 [Solitalea longa]|uniref:Uncharacterized protein n=1 Tax=Solitalea longa TaxID=2079460 RepID=A0A2S5A9S8_9SPHI|nr:hypothetical protein [Solitalea longa]POY39315.1 hypothetical protein C3K47_02115 [Solitalea longa]